MAVVLHELALKDDERLFSPFCWRVRLALCHKGIPFTSKIYRYADKEQIAPFKTWPVLEHNGERMDESMDIIAFLDKTWPDKPQLVAPGQADAGQWFMQKWIGSSIGPVVFPLCVLDVWKHLHPGDQDYWRTSRESPDRLGMTLEECAGDQNDKIQKLRDAFKPMRLTVDKHAFLGGKDPVLVDLLIFALLLWVKSSVQAPLLEKDDPVAAWHGRMSKHYAKVLEGTLSYPLCS